MKGPVYLKDKTGQVVTPHVKDDSVVFGPGWYIRHFKETRSIIVVTSAKHEPRPKYALMLLKIDREGYTHVYIFALRGLKLRLLVCGGKQLTFLIAHLRLCNAHIFVSHFLRVIQEAFQSTRRSRIRMLTKICKNLGGFAKVLSSIEENLNVTEDVLHLMRIFSYLALLEGRNSQYIMQTL